MLTGRERVFCRLRYVCVAGEVNVLMHALS